MTGIIALVVSICVLFMLALGLSFLCITLSSRNRQLKYEVGERQNKRHQLQKEIDALKERVQVLKKQYTKNAEKKTQVDLDNTLTGLNIFDLDVDLNQLNKPKPPAEPS